MSLISTLLIMIVVYWIGASLFAYWFNSKTINKYKNWPRIQTPEHCKGFIRTDFGKWNQIQIIKGSFLRFPPYFAAVGSFLFLFGLFATIKKHLAFPNVIIELLRKYYGRYSLRFWINIVQQFDGISSIQTPIVISNHVNWIDMVYMGTFERMLSFLSKKEVENVIIINAISQYLQCLKVDRHSHEGRLQIRQAIKQRVKQFEDDPAHSTPLIIYPQGTVSNGRSVMQFKNGAFETLSPLTIFSLRYECKQFHMGMDEVSTAQLTVISLSLKPTLIVRKQLIKPNSNETVDEYKERTRKKLAEMGGFITYDCNFKDILQYEAQIKEFVKRRHA